MGVVFSTYCHVSEVDAYAEQHKKNVWLCLSDDEKASIVERANRQIHAWHGQELFWQADGFNFPCILQSIYIAKNGAAMDIAEIAANASSGSYGDSINNVQTGADIQWDTWALVLMQKVISKHEVNRMPRFAHG